MLRISLHIGNVYVWNSRPAIETHLRHFDGAVSMDVRENAVRVARINAFTWELKGPRVGVTASCFFWGCRQSSQEINGRVSARLNQPLRSLEIHRYPLTTNARDPLYRAQPERWLDILTVTRSDGLAVIELKASEHIYLPLKLPTIGAHQPASRAGRLCAGRIFSEAGNCKKLRRWFISLRPHCASPFVFVDGSCAGRSGRKLASRPPRRYETVARSIVHRTSRRVIHTANQFTDCSSYLLTLTHPQSCTMHPVPGVLKRKS